MGISLVNWNVSGDCQSNGSGAVYVVLTGTSPDYRVEFLNPSLPTQTFAPLATDYTITGLTGGSYLVSVVDSSLDINSAFTFSFTITTGTCVSIEGVSDTTCGLNNGSITAQTQFSFSNQIFFSLYDLSDNLIQTNYPNTSQTSFNSLQPGGYYVISNDGGGCSGKSESVYIKSSTTLTYSLYVVNNSSCYTNLGKVFVSGLTGNSPFTYQWSNGETTPFITGLTAGIYSVVVTDFYGCTSFPQFATVSNDPPLVIAAVTSNNPSCNNAEGSITITLDGGSPPFFFSGSNGETQLVFVNNYTFDNLSAGIYEFSVVDAGLCSVSTTTSLIPTNSFVVQNVNTTNAGCNALGGQIDVFLLGGPGSYVYQLSNSNGIYQVLVGSSNATFQNLPANTYTLTVSSSTPNSCVFVNDYTIESSPKFTLNTSVTGTTCARSNGRVSIEIVGSGMSPYDIILSGLPTVQNYGSTAYTFTNVPTGNYNIQVTDNDGCVATTTAYVSPSTNIGFNLLNLNNNLSVSIYMGTPPFTITWSPPYDSLSGVTSIDNVSAGTYSVSVVDANGCSSIQTVEVTETTLVTGTESFLVCESVFTPGFIVTRNVQRSFFQGYTELITNEVNCSLNYATFTNVVSVSGDVKTDLFYTATTLNLPTNIDTLYIQSLTNIIESYYGIGNVVIDVNNNTITIETDCNLPFNLLSGSEIIVDLQIDYSISCRYCSFIFENCCDPSDTIDVGILYDNYTYGDTIIYNNICYYFTNVTGTGTPVVSKDYPDFYGTTTQCEDCRVSLGLTAAC